MVPAAGARSVCRPRRHALREARTLRLRRRRETNVCKHPLGLVRQPYAQARGNACAWGGSPHSGDSIVLLEIDSLVMPACVKFRTPDFVHCLVLGPTEADRRAEAQIQVA